MLPQNNKLTTSLLSCSPALLLLPPCRAAAFQFILWFDKEGCSPILANNIGKIVKGFCDVYAVFEVSSRISGRITT
jgi:hypothetical protein